MSTPSLPARFRLLGLLGEGGSGRVYRVHDATHSRELALKLVTRDEAAFLRREFDTLRQIRQENLIQVFDWGTLRSEESYYTMELIEGEDWGRRAGRPQDPAEVRRILTGLLRGLAHLHCHGEIHGDLKPGNVLLGLGDVVKITDVGMGGRGGRAETASGTPGYAAPEIWEGTPADIRSDLYSVGVMAYEALTGVHPFGGRTIREVVAGQLEGWVPSPGAHGVRVPADLERVVMRALERDRGLRQASADEFMEGIGVEDRVGQILGGKIVGREAEIGVIVDVLFSGLPGSPSLIRIVGPPHVGKRALLREAAHRIMQRGGVFVDLGAPGATAATGLADQGGARHATGAQALPPANLSSHAEELVDLATTSPVLARAVEHRPGSSKDDSYARRLARFLWALSIERTLPSHVLIVEPSSEAPREVDEFELVLRLGPLTREETAEFVAGRLGETRLEVEFTDAIHQLSGGYPGALETLLPSMVDRGLLERRRGSWVFRESERIRSIDVAHLPNPWSREWSKLSPAATRTLQVLCLVRSGLPARVIQSLTGGAGNPALVASLAATGWVTQAGSAWRVASEGIRQVIKSRSDQEALRTAALTLASHSDAVDPDESADLVLEYDPSLQALEVGLQAASRARARGDHNLEVDRLRRCLAIAESLSDVSRSRSIVVDLADALHRTGADSEAREQLLRDALWRNGVDYCSLARRHHVLGTVEFSLGRVDEARSNFERGAELARAARDLRSEARCVEGLAESGWQHGAEGHRSAAIERIETFIRDHGDREEIAEEMGGLIYQLGSALVRAGDHKRASEILSRGLVSATAAYWRMRIANALAAANYYVGQFDAALGNLDVAWSLAEHIGADSFKSRILANRAGLYYGLGRPGDAVDQHALAALWARRTGATFDYVSACAGASINLVLLARYEEAIQYAVDVRAVANRLGDLDEVGKGYELEALARYYIGDYTRAEGLARDALRALEGAGYLSVRPRLDWLLARVLHGQGKMAEAVEPLVRAESELKRTQDWEDLPGVQIELHRVQAEMECPETHLAAIHGLIGGSGRQPPLLVLLNGAIAIGDIIMKRGIDHRDWVDVLSETLARAEGAGVREVAWRLCSFLARFHAQDGNGKEAIARLRRGGQLLREIADQLSAPNRELYISTRHAQSLLRATSSG